jgi:hypothetical protein
MQVGFLWVSAAWPLKLCAKPCLVHLQLQLQLMASCEGAVCGVCLQQLCESSTPGGLKPRLHALFSLASCQV